jgi:hypothetical protein
MGVGLLFVVSGAILVLKRRERCRFDLCLGVSFLVIGAVCLAVHF